jgi:diguanylate cyclase (GGDEF)-like protein
LSGTGAAGGRPRILVVDDARTNLVLMERILERLDADILTATTGEQALSMEKEHQLAVMLLDVHMPGISGFEVAERIRATGRSTPIIFVTGSSNEAKHAALGYEKGAVDYLNKPVDPMILLSKVGVFVELQRKQAALERTTRELQLTVAKLERHEEALAKLARQDQLTGLANRRYFESLLQQATQRADRSGRPVGLLSIDLDGFKAINDTLGHDAGDLLLQKVASRLRGSVRVVDSVARLGGDEFTVILEGMVSSGDAAVVAERVIGQIGQPFSLGGSERFVTASVGMATYPDDASDIEGLLKCADLAMYEAKQAGKNTYRFFNPKMTAARSRQRLLARQLEQALEREELRLHYQPQIALPGGEVIGFEALMRWEHDGRLVPPAEFIPTFEETGLIVRAGGWLFRTVCAQVRAWQEQGLPPLRISVNLSARQLRDPELPSLIRQALDRTRVEPHLLELELTESLVMKDTETTRAILTELKQLGVRTSVDDFGTGFSSLSYLASLPVDVLKVDRAFVGRIPADAEGCAVTSAIIGLAHSLGLEAIAEGVETEEQLAFLKKLGCDGCQGYLLCRPQAAEDLVALFESGELRV